MKHEFLTVGHQYLASLGVHLTRRIYCLRYVLVVDDKFVPKRNVVGNWLQTLCIEWLDRDALLAYRSFYVSIREEHTTLVVRRPVASRALPGAARDTRPFLLQSYRTPYCTRGRPSGDVREMERDW